MKSGLSLVAVVMLCMVELCSAQQERVVDGIKYFLSYPMTKNWYLAQRHCQRMGMDLLEILNEEEKNRTLGIILGDSRYKGANWWCGGTDNGIEGHFYWDGSGADMDYEDMQSSEPNGGAAENCIVLWKPYTFQWGDLPCQTEVCYICKEKTIPQCV